MLNLRHGEFSFIVRIYKPIQKKTRGKVTLNVEKELLSLPKTLQGDPADQIIVVTSWNLNMPFMPLD